MENLKTVSALVKNILEHDHKARNTDNHLYLMVLEHYSGLRGIDIHAMTVPVFLKELDRRSFPGFETVRRSRQKVQATYPDLAPSEAVGKRRAKNEVVYIIGADNDYKALEAALRNKINNIERTHSGYDEYRYDLDEINHNPYELAAYLTVKFEDYTRDEVQATLQWLFEQQYELTLTEVVEIRTRTTSSTDPETGETTTEEEDYEYYILNVKLRNKGLNSVISNSGLSEDDMERYRILLQTRGNRPDIFGNDIYATPGGEYTDYDIPGEALTDTRFANMIREAEKYLGYPYVWGGSSPSTSFDCSGFVSYVINHCGNGWSVGRLTANGLMGVCDIIPKSSAKPGDLIFFQGTYDTSGASHVGIYVGNGMMIHCGNPISYASIESNYWQQHFYCFGRIRN